MFYRKVYLFLFYLILVSGCATTYAPSGWLPSANETQSEAYGGWMTLIVKPDSLADEDYYLQYDGEFISSDKANVYLLADSLYIIPRDNINSAILEIDDKNSVEYGLWTVGGCASTASNGGFLIFTAPLWLLFGIPASTGESYRDRYEFNAEISVDPLYWEDIQKFARFPQGLPKNVDPYSLSQKKLSN